MRGCPAGNTAEVDKRLERYKFAVFPAGNEKAGAQKNSPGQCG
jgi:hypothetical protein